MKQTITLLSLATIVILLANTTQQKRTFKVDQLTNDSLILQLPEEPYPYANFDFTANKHYLLGGSQTANIEILQYIITDDLATLGRVLFYDQKLSLTGTVSCASCHKQAHSFGDNVAFSGVNGNTRPIHTQHLNDLGWSGVNHFFWDGRTEFLDFAIAEPILEPDELGNTFDELIPWMESSAYYPDLFQKAFGDSDINTQRILRSLAAFIRAITTDEAQIETELKSDLSHLTASQTLGLQLFKEDCQSCHHAPSFGMDILVNNGLDSIQFDSIGNILEGRFHRAPSLRNIALTAPYMSDGSMATLRDVIDFYGDGPLLHFGGSPLTNGYYNAPQDLENGFEYTEEERVALLDFLDLLTDTTLLTDVRFSDPFVPLITSTKDAEKPEVTQWITVQPNPIQTGGIFNIVNPHGIPLTVELLDVTGRVAWSGVSNSNQLDFQRENLPSGIYFARLAGVKSQKSIQVLLQ